MGLSEKLGPLQYEEDDQEVFLGKSAGSSRSHVSGETAKVIDEEVKTIIDSCYEKARNILVDNRDKLDAMVDALLEYETIDRPQIDDIMAGRSPVRHLTGMTIHRASRRPIRSIVTKRQTKVRI